MVRHGEPMVFSTTGCWTSDSDRKLLPAAGSLGAQQLQRLCYEFGDSVLEALSVKLENLIVCMFGCCRRWIKAEALPGSESEICARPEVLSQNFL